jgi:hypothetical protein
MRHVNDFKAWMHGPSAHDERVAELKVRRESAGRAHESTMNNARNDMYELYDMQKPLEATYRKLCDELPRVAVQAQESLKELRALEMELQSVQAENDALHAASNANSHEANYMSSATHRKQNKY